MPKSLSFRKGTLRLASKYDSLVVWAVVQLVGGYGCEGKGHMEYAEWWELRGLVRVVSACKKTEHH